MGTRQDPVLVEGRPTAMDGRLHGHEPESAGIRVAGLAPSAEEPM